MFLPEKIRNLLANKNYTADNVGKSAAGVFIYDDMVLKMQEYDQEAENEYCMMRYFCGKLPIPIVHCREIFNGKSYLLMSKCRGNMACSDKYMNRPKMLCRLLSEGLKKLWSIDISDCPSDQRLHKKLEKARYYVENGLVNIDDVEPDTFGENGFKDPMELLEWLYKNKPKEELTLSHGDYCLPNIFGIKYNITGYIDLGKMGVADKWCDIALCYRSLMHNYSGVYSNNVNISYKSMVEELLFSELGIEPDWDKIRYYILLDELF